MLNKEQIEELQKKINQGKEAQTLLDEYNDLITQKNCLEIVKNNCNSCRKIMIERSYNNYIEFKVNLPSFALQRIEEIIDNEIDLINNKLNDLGVD